MTGNDPYPNNPIEVLSAMAEQVAALRPQIEASLADIAMEGVSPEAREWNNRLSDATELLDAEVTGIIDAINQSPMTVIEVEVAQTPDNDNSAEASPTIDKDYSDEALRTFIERGDSFRISEIVAEFYGVRRLPKEQFSALRRRLTHLETEGTIQYIGDGIFRSVAKPETADGEETKDLETMLEGLRTNVGAAKPKQRGRDHKRGRR